jgi:hypothetical protein
LEVAGRGEVGGGSRLTQERGDEMDKDRKPCDATPRWKVAGWWSLGGLALIGVLAVIGLVITWSSQHDTLRYELAKTFMQVLAVAFFGTLATIAAFLFQRSHAQADNQAERNRQQLASARDQRRREDDQLRSIMNETLAAYNRVKQIRRLLRADTLAAVSRIKRIRRLLSAENSDGAVRYLSLAVYDKHMTKLSNEQLEFERLKRFTPFISDERLRPLPYSGLGSVWMKNVALTEAYEDIEKYLNHVIHEYEEKRHTVPNDANVSMAGFNKLLGFLGDNFEPKVADKIDVIIETLLTALWQPLELSTDEGARPVANAVQHTSTATPSASNGPDKLPPDR